jgi:hypothetical protein
MFHSSHRVISKIACAVIVALSVGLAACSSESPDTNTGSSSRVIVVPTDAPTIQEAVNAARSGDLVLIEPGTYSESVRVTTNNIVIRGIDRNDVILDGQHKFANGFTVTSNGVAIENLTLHSFQQNAVLFTGVVYNAYDKAGEDDRVVDGYRVSYVTAFNNGLYGIYAIAARNGIIEHSYASGHPDSGFYVGQCRPCNVVLTELIAENNAIGYYGTNASGNVWVINSVYRNNRLGIAPNSQDAEYLAPQEETIVAGNVVEDNDNPNAPKIPDGFFGSGIAVGGGTKNIVAKNLVRNHLGAGIILLPMNRYLPIGNTIRDNVLENNTVDLVFQTAAADTQQNCFAANTFVVSSPINIEQVMPCGASSSLSTAVQIPLPAAPDGPSYKEVVRPSPQPNMLSPRTAPPRPMVGEPTYPTLSSLSVPNGS